MRRVLHIILAVAFLLLLVAGAAQAGQDMLYVPFIADDYERTYMTLDEFEDAMLRYGYPPKEYAQHTWCIPWDEYSETLFVACYFNVDEAQGGSTVIGFIWSTEIDAVIAFVATKGGNE